MDDQLSNTPHLSPFEAIRKENENGGEYWSARDLAKVLGYTQYNKFVPVIKKAEEACRKSQQVVGDHFTHTGEMVGIGSGAKRRFATVFLSRYACYLIVQNADPEKDVVALGQTYFTVQTRRQELADQQTELPEDQLRLLRRSQMNIYNTQLAETAQQSGVIEARDFALFQDHGYRGLYGGLGAKAIHVRKGLKRNQHILDHMGGDELAANIFRASLTKQKLEREQIKGKDKANRAHHEMGRAVRETIIRTGATPPEDLPTPTKSIQQLQRDEQLRIEQEHQPSLFDNLDNTDTL